MPRGTSSGDEVAIEDSRQRALKLAAGTVVTLGYSLAPKELPMHPATRSILVFGVYLVINGLATAILAPTMAGNMGLPAGAEAGLRPLGIVLTIFGTFMITAARQQLVPFFGYTVWGRAMAVVGLSIFISLGLLPTAFLAIVAIDGLSALWTWARMRAPAPMTAAG